VKIFQKKFVKISAVILGFIASAVVMRFWYLEEQGNFHPITLGEAYRSGQLDQDELEDYIRKFGIHTIINLRGRNAREPWYQEEIATCRKLNIRHYDLGLSADSAPSSGETERLLKIFHSAPRPVLMHCQAGADRSGLAAALWKLVVDNASQSDAEKQLSILYGHIPIGPTQVLDVFFDKWVNATKGHARGTLQQKRDHKGGL
jgi:protein tyrosine/serine phosphatase